MEGKEGDQAKKKARATKGASPEAFETGFKRDVQSWSQQPGEALASEEVLFEGDEPSPYDRSITITIPSGWTSKEGVWRITDGIRALVQEEDRQYYVDGSWPDVLEKGKSTIDKGIFYHHLCFYKMP